MSSGMVGRVFLDQFRVDRFIASGGMATVYGVYDFKRNVSLAMKVLQAELAEDPVIMKRFQREAEALTRLAHPHIVTFYGLYQESEVVFLLERYIDGPTLKEILKNRLGRGMPLIEVLTYLKAICSALGYAHASGIIHCDIKPGNVMVDHGGTVYLADFGIARYADSTTTTTLLNAGTPAYMAPEQILGTGVTPATDIYSLGVMLFEMLTGRRPFTGAEKELDSVKEITNATTGERVRYAHLKLTPPDPCSINASVSSAVSQVVMKAMSKDPAQRYASTQALYEALCAAAGISAGQVSDRLDLQWLAEEEAPVAYVTQKENPMVGAGGKAPSARRAGGWFLGAGIGCVLLVIALIVVIGVSVFNSRRITGFLPGRATQISGAAGTSLALASTFTPTATGGAHFMVLEPTGTAGLAPSAQAESVLLDTVTPLVVNGKSQTSTPSGCPGAKPQRVKVGKRAKVCTKEDRLILRAEPKLSAAEVQRIPTGKSFMVEDGPQCSDSSSWWKIRTEEGITGWVREGSDEVDPYFICPWD